MAEVGRPLATEEELQRLQDILAMFPTTEAEDERLLTGAIEQGSSAKVSGSSPRPRPWKHVPSTATIIQPLLL